MTEPAELARQLRIDADRLEFSAHVKTRESHRRRATRKELLALPPSTDCRPGRFSPLAGRLADAADLLDPPDTPEPVQQRNSGAPEPATDMSEAAA